MIVLVEKREAIARAYLSGFERQGVSGIYLEPEDFADWIATCGPQELAGIEGILAGDFDGRQQLPKLFPPGRTPLIALVDRRALEETLALFAAGFDDVIAKPVHVQELLARIGRIAARPRSEPSGSQKHCGIVVYADGRDPLVNGEVLSLPRRERRILECLFENQEAWITKTQIFNRVYGVFNDQFDESVIESHICRLRRRLKGSLGADPIESQRYLGYRLKVESRIPGRDTNASLRQPHREMLADAII